MSIVLQGSTSGSVTLQEPAVAGTTVLDLPAVSGTILTTTSPKAGNVLQVLQAVKSDTFSTSSTSYTDVTGLSVSITPTSSSSKILVLLNVNGGAQDHASFRLVRGATTIGVGVPSGTQNATTLNNFYVFSNVNQSISGGVTFLDSPATTSATTYKVQGFVQSGQLTVNGNGANSNNTFVMTSISTITVMEIAG